MQYNAYLQTSVSVAPQKEDTHAILVPNEPFVSISVIFFSDEVSQRTTLPSYVVEYNTLPSAENAKAHASPVISCARPSVPISQQGPDNSSTVHTSRTVRDYD